MSHWVDKALQWWDPGLAKLQGWKHIAPCVKQIKIGKQLEGSRLPSTGWWLANLFYSTPPCPSTFRVRPGLLPQLPPISHDNNIFPGFFPPTLPGSSTLSDTTEPEAFIRGGQFLRDLCNSPPCPRTCEVTHSKIGFSICHTAATIDKYLHKSQKVPNSP